MYKRNSKFKRGIKNKKPWPRNPKKCEFLKFRINTNFGRLSKIRICKSHRKNDMNTLNFK